MCIFKSGNNIKTAENNSYTLLEHTKSCMTAVHVKKRVDDRSGDNNENSDNMLRFKFFHIFQDHCPVNCLFMICK